ncbi:MAG: hypothetical protein M1822_002718 [Bathelium mastoideum]|nr:MAG: hypothetical protein M1822_002718 [Bathelium mastoideum]
MSNENVQNDLPAANLSGSGTSATQPPRDNASQRSRGRGRGRGRGYGAGIQPAGHMPSNFDLGNNSRSFAPMPATGSSGRGASSHPQQSSSRAQYGGSSRRGRPPNPPVSQILQRAPGHQPLHPSAPSSILGGLHPGPPDPPRSARPSTFQPLQQTPSIETYINQCVYLQNIAEEQVPLVAMAADEIIEKEDFIMTLVQFCEEASQANSPNSQIEATLRAFGSFVSGFASKGSDVDLGIVSKQTGDSLTDFTLLEHDLPRQLEKHLLDHGIGARLLTRTRIPILRVCQKPSPELLSALQAEREKWDALPSVEKYADLHDTDHEFPEGNETPTTYSSADTQLSQSLGGLNLNQATVQPQEEPPQQTMGEGSQQASISHNPQQQPKRKPWLRERKTGPLDFPKAGVGIMADINFSNQLVMHNTQLLHCYSQCDERVRPMVLFIKAWAERRKINSAFSGTLSSYGYVLMVLHFLVNVAQPGVLPNLQLAWYQQSNVKKAATPRSQIWFQQFDVRFVRERDEIRRLTSQTLIRNQDPLPVLLRNFFHYFAHQGPNVPRGGFRWRHEVLSLRTPGGVLSKEDKGWVRATTETVNGRQIRQRYLFSIEDPFEVDHNVARVVNFEGLNAIRDEFRRAWQILEAVGRGNQNHPGLFDALIEPIQEH